MGLKKEDKKIKSDMLIAEIVEVYPEVVDYLTNEYEFHCINCVLAGFETIEEGALAHGIEGKDFNKMLSEMNKLIN